MPLLALAAVIALQNSALPPPADAANLAGPAKVVCHDESISGSRIGAFHVCMSQHDWDQRSSEARDFVARFQVRNAIQR